MFLREAAPSLCAAARVTACKRTRVHWCPGTGASSRQSCPSPPRQTPPTTLGAPGATPLPGFLPGQGGMGALEPSEGQGAASGSKRRDAIVFLYFYCNLSWSMLSPEDDSILLLFTKRGSVLKPLRNPWCELTKYVFFQKWSFTAT